MALHGKPLKPVRIRSPWPERFWEKVNKTDSCWLWVGALDPHGYGRVNTGSRTAFAHRVSYELATGRAPDPALVIDHLCRVPACVNPDHLDLVPQKVNAERGLCGPLSSIRYARPRLCPQGHPIAGDNLYLYVTKSGITNRQCRTCRNRRKSRRARQAESGAQMSDASGVA